MGLKVIGAGFGRTGTTSMKEALELLGFDKCHNMSEVLPSPAQIRYFDQLSRGERPDWDEVFTGFEAAVDWPSVTYYKELMAHYPDAKVILTTRDASGWHRSTAETIYLTSSAVPPWLRRVWPAINTWCQMIDRQIWQDTFNGKFADVDHATRVFEEHNADVVKHVPAERLLVHEAKDGWEPLCRFLGKPVPEVPYPHSNEAAVIKRVVKVMRVLRYLPHTLGAFGAAMLIYLWMM